MITGIVLDKNGCRLPDEALKKKTIKASSYYELILPIRERINTENFSTKEKTIKCS